MMLGFEILLGLVFFVVIVGIIFAYAMMLGGY